MNRCPFCDHASANESAVTTSRLLAVHLAVKHLDEFHELAAHVSDDLDRQIGERAARLRPAASQGDEGLREARIRAAATKACIEHFDHRHVVLLSPCAEALADARWWDAALAAEEERA